MRAEMDAQPYYHQCARYDALHDHECERDPLKPWQVVEWEHAFMQSGSKLNEIWAIIPICWLVHRGGLLNKEINQWLALNRATDADFDKYPKSKAEWVQKRKYLNSKYGTPKLSTFKAPF